MPKPYAIVEQHLDINTATWQQARAYTVEIPPRPRIVGYYDRLDEAQVVLESAADTSKMLRPDALVVVGDGVMVSLRQDHRGLTTALTVHAVVQTGVLIEMSAAQVTLAEAMASAAGHRFKTSHIRLVERQPSTVDFGTLFTQSLPPAPIVEEDEEAIQDALRAAMTEVDTGVYWPRRLTLRPGSIHDNSTPQTNPPAIEEDEPS